MLPRDCAPFPRILQENGYSTAGVRQVAPDARRPAGPGRAVRPLAERLGLRLLLGLPRRRGRASATRCSPRTRRSSASPEGKDGNRTTSRTPWPTRRSSGCTASGPRTPTSRSSSTSRPAAATPRTTCREGVGGQVQGQVRPGLGQAARGDLRAPEGARRDPRRRGADAARRGVPRLGLARREAASAFYARQMEVYAGYSENADYNVGRVHRRDRGDGRARQHRWSSGSGATTAPAWRARSPARSTS